jgi:monoamine oxidase
MVVESPCQLVHWFPGIFTNDSPSAVARLNGLRQVAATHRAAADAAAANLEASGNHMMTISRRGVLASLLGASAGMAMTPALTTSARAALPKDAEIVVVGAGTAGIAAARRIAAAGRKVIVLEATSQVGGRCFTDATTFAARFDRGARWLYNPDQNPVPKLARGNGVDIAPVPQGQKIRIGRRNARPSETEDFLATMVRASRAIDTVARGRTDAASSAALPADLGDWTSTIRFLLGPLACGKDLDELSAIEGSRTLDRTTMIACRQGLGDLIARLAAPLPVSLSTPVTRIIWSNRDAAVETPAGRINARAVIVTASTNVLTSGLIAFAPELPKARLDAASKLRLGSLDRIAVEFKGNPLGLSRDESFVEKSSGARTAMLNANIDGSSLCTLTIGGGFGRELSAQGEAAMKAFATEWLGKLFGSDIASAIDRIEATRWNEARYIQGAISAASPGGSFARKVLGEPLGNVFFAGEATSETAWGTVQGAWESGERAADAALKRIGGAKSDEPETPARRPKRRSRRSPSADGAAGWPGAPRER